jgi:hypothetical protein
MFNTLQYAKILEEVGFSREQAETTIKILVEIMEDKLASKQDLKELENRLGYTLSQFETATRQDMKDLETKIEHTLSQFEASTRQDLKDLETKFEHSITSLESKLTIKMGTMLAATIVILTAIQKLV